MPKKEIQDYIFYKIVCLDDSCDLFYIGSTANWKARNYNHKRNCTNEKSKGYNYKVYKTIRANGGWDNFNMIEIGTAKQLTLRRSKQIEDEYRVQLKASMNDRRCYVSEEQKKEYARQYSKEYRTNNKDKIKEYARQYSKEYRTNNKDKIKEYSQEYYKNNEEKIKEYNNKYKEVNKDKIKEHNSQKKIRCECGCDVTRNLERHKKTQKHIRLMLG